MSDLVEIGALGVCKNRTVSGEDWRMWWNDAEHREPMLEDVRAAITAIEKAGYRLVPLKPTDKMKAAWSEAYPGPDENDCEVEWSAMLAAAPKVTP